MHKQYPSDPVQVCRMRDRECGEVLRNYCESCPKKIAYECAMAAVTAVTAEAVQGAAGAEPCQTCKGARVFGTPGMPCPMCSTASDRARGAPGSGSPCQSCKGARVVGTPGMPCPMCATESARRLDEALSSILALSREEAESAHDEGRHTIAATLPRKHTIAASLPSLDGADPSQAPGAEAPGLRPGAVPDKGWRYCTFVFRVPMDWRAGQDILDNRYFTAGSWSHALRERDDARAAFAAAVAGKVKLVYLMDCGGDWREIGQERYARESAAGVRTRILYELVAPDAVPGAGQDSQPNEAPGRVADEREAMRTWGAGGGPAGAGSEAAGHLLKDQGLDNVEIMQIVLQETNIKAVSAYGDTFLRIGQAVQRAIRERQARKSGAA